MYKIYRCRPVSESVERGFMHSEADLRLRKICEETEKRGLKRIKTLKFVCFVQAHFDVCNRCNFIGTMETLLLTAGVLALCGALVMAFRSSSSGAAFAYLGAVAVVNSGYVSIASSTLLFWAIAVMIILFIGWMRVPWVRVPVICRNYIVGGALVGMVAGLTLGYAAMIGGSALGTGLGGLAFSRTPAAAGIRQRMWRVLAEVGLPAVVTMTLVGLALAGVTHA